MPRRKHRRRVIAVLNFDVDEGCDHFDLKGLTKSIEAKLQRGDLFGDADDPTYYLADAIVFERVSDVVANLEDGVQSGEHMHLEAAVQMAIKMNLPGNALDEIIGELTGEEAQLVNDVGISAQLNFMLKSGMSLGDVEDRMQECSR